MTSLWSFFQSTFTSLKQFFSGIGIHFKHTATPEEISLVMHTNLFRKMNEKEFAQLISSIQIQAFKAGELILKEGEATDELFIIKDGLARVFILDEALHKIQLKELLPGNYFGEQAVAGEKFKSRNANIEAITDISLLKIHGQYLYDYLNKDETLKSVIEERKLNQAMNIAAHASIFRVEIESLFENIENPRVLEFHNKECIFKAGDKADLVYMVIQGRVKLFIPQKNNDNLSEVILNKGNLFGELGVMYDMPRSATAIADGNLRLLGIDGHDFNKDMAISNGFKLKLSRLQKMYALPLRGSIEQFTKAIPDIGNAIDSTYKLANGMVVQSTIALDKDEFSMWKEGTEKTNGIRYQNGTNHVEIFIHNHQLTGIKSNGGNDDLPELCYLLLDNVTIKDDDIALFKTTGKLKELVTS